MQWQSYDDWAQNMFHEVREKYGIEPVPIVDRSFKVLELRKQMNLDQGEYK